MNSPHQSVFLTQVTDLLDIQPTDIILDGTLGFAGHSEALLEKLGPDGLLIGLDQDQDALTFSKDRLKKYPNVSLHHTMFSKFGEILDECRHPTATKILVDLGMSSWQIDQNARGFSFQQTGPLDMRMNTSTTQTAADILATYSKDHLTHIFIEYGELHNGHRLAETICLWRTERPFVTTDDLTFAIKKSFYFNNNRQHMMRAFAQVFQALRIEINHELDELSNFLAQLPDRLAPNGRVAIITFHSLEDRIVKHFFKAHPDQFRAVGKKVIQPTYAETCDNPRCRSAKLRVLEKKSIE